jgi:hypothetical protein
MFPHRNTHKYIWKSQDVKIHNQIGHILVDRRRNSKVLDRVENKEQFRVEVSDRFAALEDLNAEVEINSAWEIIRENLNISAKESIGCFQLMKHKLWLGEICSKLFDQRNKLNCSGYRIQVK